VSKGECKAIEALLDVLKNYFQHLVGLHLSVGWCFGNSA